MQTKQIRILCASVNMSVYSLYTLALPVKHSDYIIQFHSVAKTNRKRPQDCSGTQKVNILDRKIMLHANLHLVHPIHVWEEPNRSVVAEDSAVRAGSYQNKHQGQQSLLGRHQLVHKFVPPLKIAYFPLPPPLQASKKSWTKMPKFPWFFMCFSSVFSKLFLRLHPSASPKRSAPSHSSYCLLEASQQGKPETRFLGQNLGCGLRSYGLREAPIMGKTLITDMFLYKAGVRSERLGDPQFQ